MGKIYKTCPICHGTNEYRPFPYTMHSTGIWDGHFATYDCPVCPIIEKAELLEKAYVEERADSIDDRVQSKAIIATQKQYIQDLRDNDRWYLNAMGIVADMQNRIWGLDGDIIDLKRKLRDMSLRLSVWKRAARKFHIIAGQLKIIQSKTESATTKGE